MIRILDGAAIAVIGRLEWILMFVLVSVPVIALLAASAYFLQKRGEASSTP